ncbi:hypothetical protein CDD81_1459 [Ophiocordyceps australis]|uniref:Methyltransferase type 11 domain-containing protein n=1 Tax=Ophiocordyceps australis TaxID=1399860 RepID=A0A2C5YEM0_9HYPO|nr:hypothetical protein CDD81_1459 [Ophiocordyceps australis]
MAAFLYTLRDLFFHLVEPWCFMAISVRHIPQTIAAIVHAGEQHKLLSQSAFSNTLFAHFWATIGPEIRANAGEYVVPLLEGRVQAGHVCADAAHPPLCGTIIEVGAGCGTWVDVFARIRDTHPEAPITKIYGVEPHPQSAASLTRRVQNLGLDDIYEIVPVGIESLEDSDSWQGSIAPGSVDCIVSILCMCSIPDAEVNMRRLYRLLKPGGRWYVYEHVKTTRGGPLVSLYQRLVNIPWSFLLGSCRLCCSTEMRLRAAGQWSEIDLAQPPEQPPYQIIPHLIGTLTK